MEIQKKDPPTQPADINHPKPPKEHRDPDERGGDKQHDSPIPNR